MSGRAQLQLRSNWFPARGPPWTLPLPLTPMAPKTQYVPGSGRSCAGFEGFHACYEGWCSRFAYLDSSCLRFREVLLGRVIHSTAELCGSSEVLRRRLPAGYFLTILLFCPVFSFPLLRRFPLTCLAPSGGCPILRLYALHRLRTL